MPDQAIHDPNDPEGLLRVAEHFGLDPEELTRRTISFMGIGRPRSSRAARERVADALRRLRP